MKREENCTDRHAFKMQSTILLNYSNKKNQKIGKMDIYARDVWTL